MRDAIVVGAGPRLRRIVGVYIIRNIVNNKVYVGSAASCIKRRLDNHLNMLRNQIHHSNHLQAAWNRYGSKSFKVRVVEQCSPEECLAREQYWIDTTQAYDRKFGYNNYKTAGSPFGMKHSEETKRKMSVAQKGRPRTPAELSGLAKGRANKIRTPETRAKISATLTGRKLTKETKEKIRQASLKRAYKRGVWKHSEEWKEAARKRMLGNKHGLGHSHSEETKLKISATLKRIRNTAEGKSVRSARTKKAWVTRRARQCGIA